MSRFVGPRPDDSGVLQTVQRRIRELRQLLTSPPHPDRHARWSAVGQLTGPDPSPRLLDTAFRAAEGARSTSLDAIAARVADPVTRGWVQRWPGEHYRLLSSLVEAVGATRAVEVGTFTGVSALALRHGGASVTTYDIVRWRDVPATVLQNADFDGGLEQRVGDLSDEAYFHTQREALAAADLIFVDGPKDGVFEPAFLRLLLERIPRTNALLVVDDIRLLPMVRLWAELPLPKLDLTSFGHWSGTGLAELVA